MSSNNNMFAECSLTALESGGDPNLAMLRCISNQFDVLEDTVAASSMQQRDWLMVYAGALIFFMQAGFATLVGGSVRKKNLQNTMLKNLLDVCGAAIAFWATGYAFAYGGDGTNDNDITFVGTKNFFAIDLSDNALWFFQFAFCSTSVTIIAGTLAERCQMAAYLWYSIILTGFVYPVVAHTMWSTNGKFSPFLVNEELKFRGVGCIDFAGSGVVHLTGGTTALIASYILGPRVGRFYDASGSKLDKPADIPGHSIPLQVLGTFILWFGWYGFNPGSALILPDAISQSQVAALSAANTSLSAASGALSAMLLNLVYHKYRTGGHGTGSTCYSLTMTMNGCLSGLVAITAGSATVEMWSACIIGIIAGLVYLIGSQFIIWIQIDDAIDGIPVHMFNGAWGMIATGLFTSPRNMIRAFGTDNHVGWFYNLSDPVLLGNQFIAVFVIMAWALTIMMPFFAWLNFMGWFRSDGIEEVVGLDIRYHGGTTNDVNEMDIKQDLEQYKELMNKQVANATNDNNNNSNNQQ